MRPVANAGQGTIEDAIHRLLAGNTEQKGYWVVARQSDEGVVYLNGWDKAGLDGKREASWTLNASDARSSVHPARGRTVAEGVLVVRQRSSPIRMTTMC